MLHTVVLADVVEIQRCRVGDMDDFVLNWYICFQRRICKKDMPRLYLFTLCP